MNLNEKSRIDSAISKIKRENLTGEKAKTILYQAMKQNLDDHQFDDCSEYRKAVQSICVGLGY